MKAREQVGELQLKVPLEVAVERGEGLVEQDRLRLGAEDAGERDALLLPAGELRGILFSSPSSRNIRSFSAASARFSDRLPARMPQRMFCSTVMLGKSAYCWKR